MTTVLNQELVTRIGKDLTAKFPKSIGFSIHTDPDAGYYGLIIDWHGLPTPKSVKRVLEKHDLDGISVKLKHTK